MVVVVVVTKVVLPNFGIKSGPGDGLCIIHAFRESLSYIGRNQTLEQIKGALKQEMPHTNVITQLDKYLEDPLNEYEKDTVDIFLPALGRAYGINVILDDSVHTDNALHKKPLYFVRTLSLHVDPVVPLSSSPFVSSDADDSDVDIIEVIDKSVDNTKTLKLEKMDSLKERVPNTSFDMVIDRDHPVPFNLKNPSAAELFRVLLLYPSKCEVRSPLKRCRENKMYTIKNFQISEITCDDNGSYKDSNTVKTKYYMHIDENDDVFVRGVHQINGRYYYKERNGRQYFDTEVHMENIYKLDRYYRTNKSIEQLKMMVVRIELMESEVPLPYSCVIYSLDDEGFFSSFFSSI